MQSLMSMRVQQHSTVIPYVLGAHGFSGCDTVSSLAIIGKATVFKKLATFTYCAYLGDLLASLEDHV